MEYKQNISIKKGMPPGTPLYIGDEQPENTRLYLTLFDEDSLDEYPDIGYDELLGLLKTERTRWLHISGLNDAGLVGEIASICELHPLVVEDILNTKGLSKFEMYDDYLFAVLKSITSTDGDLKKEQISLILTDGMLISWSQIYHPFQSIRDRMRFSKGRFRKNGVDYLAYAIIDIIVDGYFVVLEELEKKIEILEEEVISNLNSETIVHIQEFRTNLIKIRRDSWSLRNIVLMVERTDSPLISDPTRLYFRDVYDHILKISEDIDVFREMTEGIMSIYLSRISNNLNEIMKVLTIISTIFMPLTFIAGIYGMNFEYMPELVSEYGYPGVLVLMVTIGTVMLIFFRKKRWI